MLFYNGVISSKKYRERKVSVSNKRSITFNLLQHLVTRSELTLRWGRGRWKCGSEKCRSGKCGNR